MDDLAFEKMLRQEFLQEADEILHSFETSLLRFEGEADRGALLNEMFRYAHSLKGSGLAAGFESFGGFAHKVENLLEHMRSGSVRPSKQVIDALLVGVDTLKAFVRMLSVDGKSTLDCSAQEKMIESCLDVAPPGPTSSNGRKSGSGISKQAVPKVELDQHPPFDSNMFFGSLQPIVYVCEDEQYIREDIVDLFPKSWLVEGFESATDLLERVRIQQPHLVISDLRMPGMDGDQMISILRKESISMPVIFISAYADRENLVQFVKLQVFDFFEKPFDHDELLKSSKRALRDWFHSKTLEEISVLAFRNYMKFNSINEILDGNDIDPAKLKKIREMEMVMIRIGNLCLQAGKFGQH